MANVGLGRAATSLSELTGDLILLGIPQVGVVGADSLQELSGQNAVAVYTPFGGDMEGHIALLLPWEAAGHLWQVMVGSAPQSPDELDELSASVILEVGNIINSSFLNAIADLTGLATAIEPPCLAIEEAACIASSIAAAAEMGGSVALAIETRMESPSAPAFTGHLLCIPTTEGLQTLFQRLGLAVAA